jgi:hypothetical protein
MSTKIQPKQKPTEVSFWDFLLPGIPAPVLLLLIRQQVKLLSH